MWCQRADKGSRQAVGYGVTAQHRNFRHCRGQCRRVHQQHQRQAEQSQYAAHRTPRWHRPSIMVATLCCIGKCGASCKLWVRYHRHVGELGTIRHPEISSIMLLRHSNTRWGAVSQFLHWLILVLIVVMAVIGLIITDTQGKRWGREK